MIMFIDIAILQRDNIKIGNIYERGKIGEVKNFEYERGSATSRIEEYV